MKDLRFAPPNDVDPGVLAAIRVEAMRPSLEAIGRFDPNRARERFLATYDPDATRLIYLEDTLAGFHVVRQNHDHIVLEHLYISPEFQGRGLGKATLTMVQQEAREAQLPVKLMALKKSASNDFYTAFGFVYVSSDEFDVHYIWYP